VGHVAYMGREEVHTVFWWGKLEGRRPTGRPTQRWEDNIKMHLQELGWETCTGLIWLRRGASGRNEPAVP